MTKSRQIAGLVGPTLLVVTLCELLNWRIWASNIAPAVFLNGALLFVAGLAIVRAHNVWALRWPVLVTLIGWAVLLGGLVRMAYPEAKAPPENVATVAVIVVLALVGAILTFQAYAVRGEG